MRSSFLALTAIVGLAAMVRCQHLGALSFDFDEAFCWKMTTFGPGEIWRRAALDNHPPLYFYLLYAWSKVWGDSPLALRSLSVLFGLASVVGAYLLVRQIVAPTVRGGEEKVAPALRDGEKRSPEAVAVPVTECRDYFDGPHPGSVPAGEPERFAGRRAKRDGVALVAAMLVALSPLQIDWSQRVRMYVLGAALAVLSSWLLLRAVQVNRPRWRDYLTYALAATAFAYTHYYALFILAGQFLYAAACAVQRPARSMRSRVAAGFAVIALAWLPWAPNFVRHREQVSRLFHTQPFLWDDVAKISFQIFAVGWDDAPPSRRLAQYAAAACLACSLAMLVGGRGGLRLIAVAVLATFDGAICSSIIDRNIVGSRYFVFAHALLLCGIAALLGQIPWRAARNGALAAAVAASAWLCLRHAERRDAQSLRPGMIAAMAYLAEMRRPGEPMVVSNPILQVAAAAHAVNDRDVSVIGESASFPYFQGTAVMQDGEYTSREALARSPSSRLWVIDAFDWAAPAWTVDLPDPWVDVGEEVFPEWMADKCRIVVRRCERRKRRNAQ